MTYHTYSPCAYYWKYICSNCSICRKNNKKCSRCGEYMTNMGPKFKPPKKYNKKEWLKLKKKYYKKNVIIPSHYLYSTR